MNKEFKNLLIILATLILAVFVPQLPFLQVLEAEARVMVAIAFIAAAFWITECLPIPVTALIIILLQGIFQIQSFPEVLAYLAHPVNTLLLAGFVIAAALKKYDLDKRIGLMFISIMGERTDRIILGLMVGTAFLSMWISNTAAAAIMLPIGVGILERSGTDPEGSNLAKAVVIGLAFTANIGGMATPVGTPPVPITIAFLNDQAGISISFLGWIIRALPVVVVLLPLVWKLLLAIYRPEVRRITGGLQQIREELAEMGPLTDRQKHVFALFALAVMLWLLDSFDPFLPLPDDWLYIASMLIALSFVLPKIGVLAWQEASAEISWGVLILLGGGLALGSGLEATGVVEAIATNLNVFLEGLRPMIIITTVAFVTAFSITMFSSLTATSSTFVPVAIALAFQLNMNPAWLAPVAGMSACFAFLLPANTPPNAIAYRSGYFKTSDMTKVGVLVTVLCVTVLILAAGSFWIPLT